MKNGRVDKYLTVLFYLVDGGGFEPPKAELADLQSAPFGHSGTRPRTKLALGGAFLRLGLAAFCGKSRIMPGAGDGS